MSKVDVVRRLRARLARARQDAGIAMVAVIGLMVLVGIIAATVVSATGATVAMTTATRADVQAKAAAESGIEYVESLVGLGGCAAEESGGAVTAPVGLPEFTARIYWSTTGTATTSSATGCPPATATSVLVVSTGRAQNGGVGDSSKNDATIEALYEYSQAPAFSLNKAVFTGTNLTFNNLAKVLRDPSAPDVPADVYAGGQEYTCNAGSLVEGSVYFRGGSNPVAAWFKNQNGACTIKGDLVSRADVFCYGGMTVGGNLYTQRRVGFENSGCKVNGNIGVNLGMTSTGGYQAGKDVQVNGNYSQSNDKVTVGGRLSVAGNLTWGFGGPTTKFPFTHPAAKKPIPNIPDDEFPKITDDWINTNFAGWDRPGWKATLEPVRPPGKSWVNVCDVVSDNALGVLEITENTILDSRTDCGANVAIGGDLTIRLKADLAIIGTHIKKNKGLRIESGDGKEHELYILSPWDPAIDKCDSAGSSMVWGNGSHTQDSLTRVFIYSPQGFKTEAPHTIRGQLYACHATFSTDQTIIYAPVKGLGGDPSAGDSGLRLVYQRDAE